MNWLEIEIDTQGEELTVSARGSRGERPAPQKLAPDQGLDALNNFSNKVARAIRARKELDPPVVELSQSIYAEVLKNELRDILVRMTDPSKDARTNRVLIRLFLRDRALLGIPWEALCKPGTTEGHWGIDPRLVVARGIHSPDPLVPREVMGAVSILVIAPGNEAAMVQVLRTSLAPAIDAGEVEWLEPIAGSDISPKVLFDRLRRGKTPNIVHFVGHGGVDMKGRPSLRLADDDDGEEVWMTAEALARELTPHFFEGLRLVILEACEGAKAGVFGSAAEELAKAGADAVIAHLWPVKADVARLCSTELYRSLTSTSSSGDIGTSITAARRTMLTQGAEAFSPILFLRGSDSILFDFSRRKVTKPSGKRRGRALAPPLQMLLDKPPFTLVVGDIDEDRELLRKELLAFLHENGDTPDPTLPLSVITQRCMLKFGEEVLQSLFQQTIASSPQDERPLLLDAMGALVPPGVHVTLLWRPHLERSIAEQQPDKTLYAIQVSMTSSNAKPRTVKRAAGTSSWKMEPTMPKRFDVDRDIIILRMYGGYSPESRPIFSQPVLTEDDHIHGLLGERPPQWLEELLAWPRTQPGLFLGLSVLDWRNRLLLRWLYDQRPAPKDSLAILPPAVDPSEPEIWDTGGGLPGTSRIAAIIEESNDLAHELQTFAKGGA